MSEVDKLVYNSIGIGQFTSKIFNILQLEKFIDHIASRSISFQQSVGSGKDPITALIDLTTEEKNQILKVLADDKKLCNIPKFWGIIPHMFRPQFVPKTGINTFSVLAGKRPRIKFDIDFPINPLVTFIGFQYLRLRTEKPVLAKKYGDQYDLSKIKYKYVNKPGIRAFRELQLTSNGNIIQTYDYKDLLRFYTERLPENVFEIFNKLIGHDLGYHAEVYNHFTETKTITKLANGYQTPKADQDGLDLFIPLFFDHNMCFESKFNISSFIEGTMTVEGTFEYSHLMVKAQYYEDDLTIDPIDLDCEPLRLAEFGLGNECFFVSDRLHNIMLCKNLSKFVRYWHNQTGTIKDNDPMNMIEIKGKGDVEAYTFCIRPKSYDEDFEKWEFFSEVEKICCPTPIIVPSAPGVFNAVAVKPSSAFKQISPLESIMLEAGGFELKPEYECEYYSLIEQYKMARTYPHYRPRDNFLYKFNFNYFYMTECTSGIFPQAKFPEKLHIFYKFRKDYIDYDGLLNEPWEYIIFRDLCNQQISKESSVITLFPV